MKRLILIAILACLASAAAYPQKISVDKNKPERVAWFQKLGFGLFIHWSVDVQLGAIISHNVAAGSQDYQDRYFNDLPKTFNPKRFDPDEWAVLAKLAGMKYVVFTAKHHNGFCMWDTETSEFNIMNTPFGRDAFREIAEAFRRQGIAIGVYFSPDDYYVMYKQGLPPSRNSVMSESPANKELWEINKKQLRELLTNYGKIDMLFIDEKTDWANPLVAGYGWEVDPDLLVTRGGMATPEQHLPDEPLSGPWEACFTIGSHWQYVGEEPYKDATTLIEMLIETRAKGGNLLLNAGPNSQGEIPLRQQTRLREIALWYMANHEAVDDIKPWEIIREDDVWFTQSPDGKAVYAFVNDEDWEWMERRSFLFRTLRGGPGTKVSILGQNAEMMEYSIEISPAPLWEVTPGGIFVNVIKAQRLNKTWDNPLVVKLENVRYARAK